MKIIPNYENSVAVIPSRVIDFLSDATGDDMAVLIVAMRDGAAFDPSSACAELGIDRETLDDALKFWEDRAVISIGGGGKKKSSRSVPFGEKNGERGKRRNAARPSGEIQPPGVDEQAAYLETHESVKELIDWIGKHLEKNMTRADVTIIVGILQNLGVGQEYVMLLIAYIKKRGIKAMKYVEKMAYDLYDEGITSYGALEEELRAREQAEEFEGKVRRVFGLGKRALTKKEKGYLRSWHVEWGYGEDVVTEAYEITVGSTNEASLPYANTILEKWHSLGIATVEEAREYQKNNRGKKKQGNGKNAPASFDTTDFFEDAITRSYGKKDK